MASPSVECSTIPVTKDDDEDNYDLGAGTDEEYDLVDMETTCPGLRFTKEEEEEITCKWLAERFKLCGDHADLMNEFLSRDDENSPLPGPGPLKVLPDTTASCIERGYCYHREYMTNDISDTAQTVGYVEPHDMLQVLSLRLLHTESCPISVYGIFAVRDDLDPRRNYVFNRTRDDPVMIQQDSFALPLCSPFRGMYILDRALLEVDLWIKQEGNRSTDEQLLSVFVEINIGRSLDVELIGRIHGGRCMLDMSYMFLSQSVEATIHILALADYPCHVRFVAFCSCFDDGIILFEDKGIKKGDQIRHVVAIKAEEKMDVHLELGNSHYTWTFQDGIVGLSSARDDPIINQFQVKVLFDPKKQASSMSRYYDWKRRCRKRNVKPSIRDCSISPSLVF